MYKEPSSSAEEDKSDVSEGTSPSGDGVYAYPHDISTEYPAQPPSVESIQPTPPEASTANRAPMYIGLCAVGLLLLSLVLALGGREGERFLAVGLQFAPLAALAALAYGGVKNSASAMFAYLWLAVLAFGLLFLSLGLTIFAFSTFGLLL